MSWADRMRRLLREMEIERDEAVALSEGLSRRLSKYECLEHERPKFGECDECDGHNPEPREQLGPWS
jgi:hypothetical protein